MEPAAQVCPSCGVVPPSADPRIGQVIADKYRILSRIAIGGTSTIYRAEQELIRREVALKIMSLGTTRDPSSAHRFKLEAEKASSLNHPNAVTIYDFGETKDGSLYLAMEYVKGKNLREVLHEEGTLPESRAIHILKQVCEVLAQAHRRGIIHRDLKPDNLMIEPERSGRTDWVVVLDFGIAKTYGDVLERLTMTGNIVGTPHYMSPEQCEGRELDTRSDIYSLGILMYEMLTGKVPFDSPSSSVIPILMMHVQERPRPLRAAKPDLKISPHLEKTIMRALAKDKHWRQADAAELLRDLRRCEEHKPPSASAHDRTARVPIPLPLPPTPPGARTERRAARATPAASPTRHGSGSARATSVAGRLTLGILLVGAVVAFKVSLPSLDEKVEPPPGAPPAGDSTGRIEDLVREGSRVQAANPMAAMDVWREILQLDRENLDGLWGLAVASEKIGRAEQAEAYYRQFLDTARRRGDVGRLEPQVLMARNRLKEMDEARGLVEEAERLARSGHLPEAITVYRRHLAIHPASAAAQLGLGGIYIEQERWADAIEALERACQLEPDSAEAQFARGLALFHLDRFSEAADAFAKTLEEDPDHPTAARYLQVAEARAKGR